MNKIEAKHTCTIIHDYNMGDCPKLEHFFSLWDNQCHKYYPKAIKYDEEKKDLYIPRGYSIPRLEAYFGQSATINTTCDPFDDNLFMNLKYLPRNGVQKEAIAFIIGISKYKYTQGKSQLAINLNTGVGKTYVTVVAAAIMHLRAIMITSSIGWINQWVERITEYTNTRKSEIYIIEGMGTIAQIINGMMDVRDYKYILASHQTIRKYGDTHGWDKVGELFKKLRVGLKLYDEAHLDFDNICKIDFATDTMKTLYLTATPLRSDPHENIIYQASFKMVPSIDLFNEDTDPRTHYLAIMYNSHPSPMDITNCKNAYGFNGLAYTNYVVHRPNFYKLLRILIEISLSKGKTLMYVSTNKAIKTIVSWVVNQFPELADDIGIYTTLIKDPVLKEMQLTKNLIFSTTKSCGAAIDIEGLKLTVVLAETFKSEILARQSIGRTRDKDTTYIDIVDYGFYSLMRYYNTKIPIFKKYAIDTAKDRFDDEKLNDLYVQAIAKQGKRYEEASKKCKTLMSIVEMI